MSLTLSDEADLAWLVHDAVARQARLRPDRTAIVERASGRSITYAELEQQTRRCEALLRRLTRTPGARIVLLARNSARHALLFYAAARAGVIFAPLNWRLTAPELAALLVDAQPEVVIYETEFEVQAQVALAQAPGAAVIRISPDVDGFAEALAGVAPAEPGRIAPLAPSMLLYTSGTTGRPKAVTITPKTAFFAAVNFAYAHDFAAQHVQLCDVPLFHVVGALPVMHATISSGGRLYISDRFDPPATLEMLGDRNIGVTHYFCVPQIAEALVNAPGFAATDFAGLALITGGAPMPPALTVRLIEAGIQAVNGYGMSEIGTALGMPMDPATARRKAGAAGLPAPAVEVRLVDAVGRDVGPGEIGEIWLRGPSVTPGYWGQPEATAKAFVDGWLRTGDAARCDEEGFYFLVDRWKDMYISGGENVFPAEVEAAIASFAGVEDVAVVGAPDPRWGERGCAFVVRRGDRDCTVEGVLAHCGERLARYKLPSEVIFVDLLPRTASGKVRKDVLRRWAVEGPATLR